LTENLSIIVFLTKSPSITRERNVYFILPPPSQVVEDQVQMKLKMEEEQKEKEKSKSREQRA